MGQRKEEVHKERKGGREKTMQENKAHEVRGKEIRKGRRK